MQHIVVRRRPKTTRGLQKLGVSLLAVLAIPATARGQAAATAQDAPPGIVPGIKIGGSPNMHLVAHIPLGGYFRVMDDEIEQDPDRPYAYVSQSRDRPGFTIIDLRDLNNVKVLYHWSIENPALHKGSSAAWTGSTSSSTTGTTTCSRSSSCKGRPTPTWARSSST